MISAIQAIVILVSISIIISVLAGRQTHAAKAWKKLALCVLALAMIVAVLLPEVTNSIANVFGVGRGADLLLYILTLAFIGYTINNYLHQQREKEVMNLLARRLALHEAESRMNRRKKE